MQGIVMFRRAGTLIPRAYLEKVLPEFSSCIGGAALHSNKSFEVAGLITGLGVDEFMTMQEQYKDVDSLYHIGKTNQDITIDDLQPFIAVGDADKIYAVGAIEGDFFPKKPDPNEVDETQIINNYIQPKLNSLFELHKKDIGEFMKALRSDVIDQEMSNTWQNRGTIVVWANNDDVIRFEENDRFRQFDWGWTTNHANYDASELRVDPPTAAPKPAMFGGAVKVDAPAATPATTPTTLPPGVHKVEPAPAEQGMWIRPPIKLQGDKNKLKKWYPKARGTNGVPDSYMTMPAVFVTPERLARAMEKGGFEFRQVSNANGDPLPDKETPKPAIQEPKAPDVKPAAAPEPGKTYEPMKPPQPEFPIIVPEDVEKWKVLHAKINARKKTSTALGLSSMELALEPSKIQGVENKLPTFTQRTGATKEDLYALSFQDLSELIREAPVAATVLLFNLLCAAAKIDVAAGKVTKPEVAKTPEVITPAPAAGSSPMFGKTAKVN